MRFYDDISFENEAEEIKYLKELKAKFDILEFFNKKVSTNDKYYGKYSGVIVITPEQMVTIYPVFLHSTAISFLYYLLYNSCDEMAFNQTNNIIIKLVNGRCKLFNVCAFPGNINEYQKLQMQSLLDELKGYDHDINFGDEGSLTCFKETYEDACNKLKNAVVTSGTTAILKDSCIIDADAKKILMKEVE